MNLNALKNLKSLKNQKPPVIIAAVVIGLMLLYALYWVFSFVIQILLYAAIIFVIYLVLKSQGFLKKE